MKHIEEQSNFTPEPPEDSKMKLRDSLHFMSFDCGEVAFPNVYRSEFLQSNLIVRPYFASTTSLRFSSEFRFDEETDGRNERAVRDL